MSFVGTLALSRAFVWGHIMGGGLTGNGWMYKRHGRKSEWSHIPSVWLSCLFKVIAPDDVRKVTSIMYLVKIYVYSSYLVAQRLFLSEDSIYK